MGFLPPERLRVNEKPWSSTTMDLLGHYKVRAMPNRRNLFKVWPIIFNCMTTGALHVEVADGYGADAFLNFFICFTSVCGSPDTTRR